MEKIPIQNLKKEIRLKSNPNGDLMHSAYALLVYNPGEPIDCNDNEKYHRLRIEVVPPTDLFLHIHISNELNRKLKREFIARYERAFDPLVPKFREGLTSGAFNTKISDIARIPLMLLPNDSIFMAMHGKKPFEALLRLEW